MAKKQQIFGCWNGYRGNFTGSKKKEKPCFQVKKCCSIFRRDSAYCEVTMGFNKCWIVGLGDKKPGFKIINVAGDVIAEVKQKQLSCGMVLGDDVLTLEVQQCVDHSLIVALVTVYGLIKRRL